MNELEQEIRVTLAKQLKDLGDIYDKNIKDVPQCKPITKDTIQTGYKIINAPTQEFSQNDSYLKIECDASNGWRRVKDYKGNHIQCNDNKDVAFEGCEKYQCNIGDYITSNKLLSISDSNKKRMEQLLKSSNSNFKVCDNLQDINTSCSLTCKFGYEPSNLKEYLQEGTRCSENGKITEKKELKCRRKTCSKSELDTWFQKESSKKKVLSNYKHIITDHCFTNNKMKHNDKCILRCDHMNGYSRKTEINSKNIPIEEVLCSNGTYKRIKKKNTNTQCYMKQFPKLKDFPCLDDLDTFIKNKKGSLLYTKESCVNKQNDLNYGHCYLLKKADSEKSEKNKFVCERKQRKNSKNEVQNYFQLV